MEKIKFYEKEFRAIDSLIDNELNARLHSDKQIKEIEASIIEFGFTVALLIDENSVIIAGHGRKAAAINLGLQNIPCIVLTGLSDEQKRALLIADNKIAANASWDEEKLLAELEALRDFDFDLDLTGFSSKEVAELEAELAGNPDTVDPNEVPNLEPYSITQEGDIWTLGEHRLMCGDSTSSPDVEKLCGNGGEVIDCLWTDPPYNVNYEGTAGKIMNDHMDRIAFWKFLAKMFENAFKVMRKGAPFYVAHADIEGESFRSAMRENFFKFSGSLVWVKDHFVLGRSDYQWQHELILYGWKPGGSHKWYGGRKKTSIIDSEITEIEQLEGNRFQLNTSEASVVITGDNIEVEHIQPSVFRIPKPKRSEEHPTMKPVELIIPMLLNSTMRDDIVLDLFGGSGSTMIAAEQIRRRAFLMELDPKFCDVIIRRWQNFTGQIAKRHDHKTFEELSNG